ncbi:MAG: cupin domain-containing protein [Sciscionella sp.]
MYAKPELEFHIPEGEWTRPNSAERGVWVKTLSLDPESGDETLLQRYDPGVDTSAAGVIRHDHWEEVIVLSGDITDLSLRQEFMTGMYACRPIGMAHGPYSSRGGCLMFVTTHHT